MHCEIIDSYFNVYFLELELKKKTRKNFLGARARAPKPLYWSPKRPEYVIPQTYYMRELFKQSKSSMCALPVNLRRLIRLYIISRRFYFIPLSAKFTKWSSTLKQFIGCCRRIVWVCLTILWDWSFKGYTYEMITGK